MAMLQTLEGMLPRFNATMTKAAFLDIGSNVGWQMEAAVRFGFTQVAGVEVARWDAMCCEHRCGGRQHADTDCSSACALRDYVTLSKQLYPSYAVYPTIASIPQKFDFASIMHVAEHLWEPWPVMREAAAAINPGGILVGEVPDGCPPGREADGSGGASAIEACVLPWRKVHAGSMFTIHHANYFTPGSLRLMLTSVGLNVLDITAHYDQQNCNCYKVSAGPVLRSVERRQPWLWWQPCARPVPRRFSSLPSGLQLQRPRAPRPLP